MTQYQRTLDSETLQRLFTGDGQVGRLVEAVLNQVLNAQVTEQLQAAPYERSEQRHGYRNGYKPRHLTTRVGALTLLVPQVREGQFSTELFARSQRSEQALVLTLMEMVVNGVSTGHVQSLLEIGIFGRLLNVGIQAVCIVTSVAGWRAWRSCRQSVPPERAARASRRSYRGSGVRWSTARGVLGAAPRASGWPRRGWGRCG